MHCYLSLKNIFCTVIITYKTLNKNKFKINYIEYTSLSFNYITKYLFINVL